MKAAIIFLLFILTGCQEKGCQGLMKNIQKNVFGERCLETSLKLNGNSSGNTGTPEPDYGESFFTQFGSVTKKTGGSNTGADECVSVAVDSEGNSYCAGQSSGNFGEANGGGQDAFVMKLDNKGSLLWLTHLGSVTAVPGGDTSGNDYCNGVAVDSSGNVYCAGSTTSNLGETKSGAGDAFILKLDSEGDLVWLKQLGTTTVDAGGNNSGAESCESIAVDSSGNVYCAGTTTGSFGESSGGGGQDAFILKLDSAGNIVWLTHLGGSTRAPGGNNSGAEICLSVAVDALGSVYCSGYTNGPMGENVGGGTDIFVMKLNSSGSLTWLTHLGNITRAPGGSNAGTEFCYGLDVDASGNVYCGGSTSGNMGEANGGSNDLFVAKFSSLGSLTWLKQFGSVTTVPGGNTSLNDVGREVQLDSDGNIYFTGSTHGSLGETSGGSIDAFMMKLNPLGNLEWITQFGSLTTANGGNNLATDMCTGLGVDERGNAYCGGLSSSDMGEDNAGSADVIMFRLNPDGTLY